MDGPECAHRNACTNLFPTNSSGGGVGLVIILAVNVVTQPSVPAAAA